MWRVLNDHRLEVFNLKRKGGAGMANTFNPGPRVIFEQVKAMRNRVITAVELNA